MPWRTPGGDLLNRVRQPFNVNSLALAGAAAALADSEFIARSKAVNDAGMAQLLQGCQRLAWLIFPRMATSSASKSEGTPPAPRRCIRPCCARGHRSPGGQLRPAHLPPVSIGLPEQNARFLPHCRIMEQA